jgi:flagellar hook-associated protein 2
MAMTFDGIASGLPTDQMIKAIMSQESAPLTRLQNKQDMNNLRKNALSSIKSSLMSISTAMNALNSSAINKRSITSSNNSVATATASGAAKGSYDLVVDQLATKARLETTNHLSSTTASVGAAGEKYTLVGKNGTETEIELQDGKTSLADLNNAINAKSSTTGITSTIIQKTPGQYHLVLTSTETGEGSGDGKIGLYTDSADNALGLATKDAVKGNPDDPDDDNLDLAKSFGVTSTAGQNAKFKLNGVDMERGTNTFSDAIEGVTLTLNSVSEGGKAVTLSVDLDKGAITKLFQDVVDKFNAAFKAYKDATASGGPLDHDMSMQAIFTQLRSKMSVTITGTVTDDNGVSRFGVLGSSSSIGLSTNRDGTLSLDAKALGEALDKDPELVGQIFDKAAYNNNGTKRDGAIAFLDSMTIGGGSLINTIINGIDSVNSLLTKQIDNLNSRLTRREEVLKAQFAKMETLIGQMQKAGQSLGGLSSLN